ncbi:rod shape-determining protein MreD [Pelagirhabdus alkalitolerans]|uniref:Rod shape-determining protein MreD n=1 Tax=Pelagirhabdus alkalitolerans TaxID=1612202 RepID=A0A1G6HP67_9BACI|nr:rod shape-determining protein MreD [Pelagirhabdus alkalitolerans]SDB96001.1 rod shape-determining protein MreD [Pelagirhabdus alkalitolerans]
MYRLYLPSILILLVVFQGAVLQFIPAFVEENGWILASHSVFLFLILFSLFYDQNDTYYGLFFAILFGLVIDMIYTNILGVYMFSYGLTTYFVHGLRKILHANFYVALLIAIFATGFVDFMLFTIYQFIGVAQLDMANYFYQRLIPTVILNSFIFILLYLLFKRRLVKWSNDRFEKKL